jgi:putative ABC transport system permease protein
MKFLPLILRNALRNRLRSTLTMLGIVFMVFVLVFITTVLYEMTAWEDLAAPHHRVVVQHALGLTTPLPIELENFLLGDEVAKYAQHVTKFNWVGAYYQNPDYVPASFAVDIDPWRQLWSETAVSDEDFARLKTTKTGVLVGASLMKKHDWKVGQRITMIGTYYPFNPELDIVGVLRAADVRQEEIMVYRWDYFDEMMNGRKIVGTWWMKARSPDLIPKLKDLIDGRTRNSSDPTETITEREFANQFMQMMGNIKGMVLLISGSVLLIMVLMTANTMAMSVRERVTEVAVLRTLGFRSSQILSFIVLESVFITMTATALSLGVAFLLFNVLRKSPNDLYFPVFMIAPSTAGGAMLAALVCGVASSIIPAVRAARRKIVDGLRQVV